MNSSYLFPVPKHWESTTLGDICQRTGGNIQTGPFGSQLHADDYVAVGIPSIMPQNITNDRISIEAISYISEMDAKRLSRYLVQEGDIVYSRRGDVERRALVTQDEEGWLCGTGCLRIRFGPDDVISKYTYYYLGHPQVKQWIVRHAVGATMPNLNTSILSAVPFTLPPPAEQRAIASILGSLDDKIELNRKTNATLEELARTLFHSWFVEFAPVRAKAAGNAPHGMDAATTALFPDSFEDSPLGKVPRGWEVGTLGEIGVNVRRGVQPDSISLDTPYIGLEHMPRHSIALAEWGNAEDVTSNKSSFDQGDILFGKLRPYFHKVGVAIISGVCSTDILVIAPTTSQWFGIALSHLSSDRLINYADAASAGTKMPRTNWSDLAKYQIILPPTNLAERFNEQILPMVQKIRFNILATRELIQIRDTLLPKLLSGALRVKDIEAAL